MLDRLIHGEFLISRSLQEGAVWTLGERNAYVLEGSTSVSIGIVLNVPNETGNDWLNQASLMLAASVEARDCGLQYRDNGWLLWCYFDENQDDESLSQSIVFQLAIARFIEKGLDKPLDHHRASIIGRTA